MSVEIDPVSYRLLVSALRKEADGKELRRDLIRGLRVAAQPALTAVRAAVMSMPSSSSQTPGLRASVASHTRITVRLSRKRPGVSIKASKRGLPRGFRNAPKNLNRGEGWRHPVFGDRENWVPQVGRPGWFDDTLRTFKPSTVEAAKHAMDAVARRISARTRG